MGEVALGHEPGPRLTIGQRVARAVWVVLVVGLLTLGVLVALVFPVNAVGVTCGRPAIWLAVDADAVDAPGVHHSVCQDEAQAQTVAAAFWLLFGGVALAWPRVSAGVRGRWEAWVLARARSRGVWHPSQLLRLAWLALAATWLVWVAVALSGGELFAGVLGVLRIAPVLLFMLPPPWVRLAARPHGLEIVGPLRRRTVPWHEVVAVEAGDHCLTVWRTDGGRESWDAVKLPMWRPRRRRPYAEGIAEAVNAEVGARRGLSAEQVTIPASALQPPPVRPLGTAAQVGLGVLLVAIAALPFVAIALQW